MRRVSVRLPNDIYQRYDNVVQVAGSSVSIPAIILYQLYRFYIENGTLVSNVSVNDKARVGRRPKKGSGSLGNSMPQTVMIAPPLDGFLKELAAACNVSMNRAIINIVMMYRSEIRK